MGGEEAEVRIAGFMLAVIAGPAWGQTVTLADLEGVVVQASVGYQNHARWNGKEIQNRSRTHWTISLGRDGAGRSEWSTTVQNAGRSYTSAPISGSFTVAQARQAASLGSGHALWVFDNGVLTLLRTYRAGGFKLSIAFTRSSGRLTCTIRAVNLHEIGAGNTRRDSPFGGDYEIISEIPTGSTCNVTKG